MWSNWVGRLKKQYCLLNTLEGMRTFLGPSKQAWWDSRGRLYIPARLRAYADLKPGSATVLVGMEWYFELWGSHIFNEMAQKCERGLRETRDG